ncbi:hypothetical protein ACLMAJ_34095 [Nocardia sp. KC 131]|uniref:hypothetical protein n=1 Tax=Nocardia arseniciresistens TaxID=3392119 RepID=UPI00398E6CC8
MPSPSARRREADQGPGQVAAQADVAPPPAATVLAPAVALPSPTSPPACLLTTGSALFCIGIT